MNVTCDWCGRTRAAINCRWRDDDKAWQCRWCWDSETAAEASRHMADRVKAATTRTRSFEIPTAAVAPDNIIDAAIARLADDGVLAPSEIVDVLDIDLVDDEVWSVTVVYS